MDEADFIVHLSVRQQVTVTLVEFVTILAADTVDHHVVVQVTCVNMSSDRHFEIWKLARCKFQTDGVDLLRCKIVICGEGLDKVVELCSACFTETVLGHPHTIRYQLKTLNWQCGLYTKTKTMMKNNLIALLDQTYPGVNDLFGSPVREDGTQKWVDFTASFWHVDCVRGMSKAAFAQRYAKWCNPRRKRGQISPQSIPLRPQAAIW